MSLKFDIILDQPFKCQNQLQICLSNLLMTPHHVAIRICVYAAPRCKSSQNFGAGGDCFPPCEETGRNKSSKFATICEEVGAYSRFVWANSVKVRFGNFRHCEFYRAKSLSTRGSGHLTSHSYGAGHLVNNDLSLCESTRQLRKNI